MSGPEPNANSQPGDQTQPLFPRAPGSTAAYIDEPPACQAVLEVIAGPHQGAVFQFDGHATFTVGRSKASNLCLQDDPYFSRHHFLVELQPPLACLRDLGSRGGTAVNGEKVKEARLAHGDEIGGGRTRLRFSLVNAPTGSGDERCVSCGIAVRGESLCRDCREKALARPQHIPGYEIIRELGRGGMGIVYLARHAASGRAVALKLIVPESAASERMVQMFLREVSVLSQLEHARIVRFHEVGSARGQFYFAMDYVEAVDARKLLAELPFDKRIKTASAIACQALEALGHAHERGFVHRDVKPNNLLVSRQGRKLRVKVADFGLAKNFQNAGLSGLTRDGDACGSLAYMPPEQVLDCRHTLPAADLYSTAATLFDLLTNRPPHNFGAGKDPYLVILEDEPAKLREVLTGAPEGLEACMSKGLARAPADRFASAAEMYRALLPFATGRSEAVGPQEDEP